MNLIRSHPSANPMHNEVWGVIGGMGPLASAEFLKTIYDFSIGAVEQDAPVVILCSDPRFPDRTDCLLNGREDILQNYLEATITQLLKLNVSQIVICCLTIHAVIPALPDDLRERIISLMDIILENVLERGGSHLLICTNGVRKSQLFQNHPLWARVHRSIVMPDVQDQAFFHQLIYELKRNRTDSFDLTLVENLLAKYRVDSFIAGCTEIHLLARQWQKVAGRPRSDLFVDPLTILAMQIAGKSVSAISSKPYRSANTFAAVKH